MNITRVRKGDKITFTIKSGEVLTSRVYRVIEDTKHPMLKVHDPRYGMCDEFINVLTDQIQNITSQADEIDEKMKSFPGRGSDDMEL